MTSCHTHSTDNADVNTSLPPALEAEKSPFLCVKAGMTTFTSNGLLDSISTVASISQLSTTEMSFVSNGLLDSHIPFGSVDDDRSEAASGIDSLSTDVFQASNISFLPTRLLSRGSIDEDLPTVSEAFGISSVLLPSTTTESFTTLSRSSIRATTFDGKTVYMRKRCKVTHINRTGSTSSASSQRMGNLLDVPIHRMMEELSVGSAAQLQKRDLEGQQPRQRITPEDTLWVDRYRPRRFAELMGNERVAREAMAWVKQWDYCVFGKRGIKRARYHEDDQNSQDEYHRPKEKLLLISGPPGLGKTTLAHVVACQAGYEVMEINASDARSGQVVDDRIRPALESGSAVGSIKPVLLIIDEIDGATGAGEQSSSFIHKLIQLTQDRWKRNTQPGRKRDPNAKRPILRPIICICNDINASSLTKLRPHAYQLRYTRPADVHTVKRLKEVCVMEGLKADSRALSTLAGIAKGDLRGCLNTLQFIRSRNEEVTESVIRKATVGMKEADSSLLSILNNLFSPMTKKRAKELAIGEAEEAKYVVRLAHEIEGSGRENGVATGCFAHYATLHRHDANLSRYEKANQWLTTFDLFSSAMYSDGDFALIQYLPFLLVPFYPLFQERGGPRVERSQEDWENLQVTRSNEEIYKSLSRCLRGAATRHSGSFRHLCNTPIVQLEFAPYINRIIAPPLRPVNSQIIRPEERAVLNRLVEIMAALEMRFVQERAEDGQLTYRLDPAVDVFVTYDGKRATDISVSRYAVRHIVAQEIDTLLITKETDIIEKGKRGKHDLFSSTKSQKEHIRTSIDPNMNPDEDEASGHPSKRAKLDSTDIADKPPTDFFGRLITMPSISATKAAVRKNVAKKFRISYKFAEGNSAAVRKPVKVGMFL